MQTQTKRIAKVGLCVLVITMMSIGGQHNPVLADTTLVDSTVSVAGCYGFGIPALDYGDKIEWHIETDGRSLDVRLILWSEWEEVVGCPEILDFTALDQADNVVRTSSVYQVRVTKQLCLALYNDNLAHVEVSVLIKLLEEPAPPLTSAPVTITETIVPMPLIQFETVTEYETVTLAPITETVIEKKGITGFDVIMTFLGLAGCVLIIARRRK